MLLDNVMSENGMSDHVMSVRGVGLLGLPLLGLLVDTTGSLLAPLAHRPGTTSSAFLLGGCSLLLSAVLHAAAWLVAARRR
jgi:hypothetical protein